MAGTVSKYAEFISVFDHGKVQPPPHLFFITNLVRVDILTTSSYKIKMEIFYYPNN